jgi:hypothetical protein
MHAARAGTAGQSRSVFNRQESQLCEEKLRCIHANSDALSRWRNSDWEHKIEFWVTEIVDEPNIRKLLLKHKFGSAILKPEVVRFLRV